MSIGNESGASRRFVAHPPFWGSKFASITTPAWQKYPVRSYLIMVVGILAFTAVLGGLYMGAQMFIYRSSGGSNALAEVMDKVIRYGFVALLVGGSAAGTGGLNGRDTESFSSTSRGTP
jgi:hypothetical protein